MQTNVLEHQTQIRELKKRQGARTTSPPLYFAPYLFSYGHTRAEWLNEKWTKKKLSIQNTRR